MPFCEQSNKKSKAYLGVGERGKNPPQEIFVESAQKLYVNNNFISFFGQLLVKISVAKTENVGRQLSADNDILSLSFFKNYHKNDKKTTIN